MRQEERGGKKKQWNKASGKRRGWTVWRRQTEKVREEGELFVARLRCVFFRAVVKGQKGFVGADFHWRALHCLFSRPWGYCPFSTWWTGSRLNLWCCCICKDSYNNDCVKFTSSVSTWKGSGRKWPFYRQQKKLQKIWKPNEKTGKQQGLENYLSNLEVAIMTVL